jgi:hypothetical protein
MRFMRVRLFNLKGRMKTETQSKTDYPFTADQYKALTPERREVIEAVADHLAGSGVPNGEDLDDEEITWTFNLLKPCEGAVQPEEIEGDLLAVIHKKFGAVHEVALKMAEAELKRQNYSDFGFCLLVDPCCQNATHVVVVDHHKAICHLHEVINPCDLSFDSLAKLADAVLGVKNRLVERITKPIEILLIMEGGVVHEIVDLPDNINVTLIDYDTEDVEKERLEISPVDGELCVITRW